MLVVFVTMKLLGYPLLYFLNISFQFLVSGLLAVAHVARWITSFYVFIKYSGIDILLKIYI